MKFDFKYAAELYIEEVEKNSSLDIAYSENNNLLSLISFLENQGINLNNLSSINKDHLEKYLESLKQTYNGDTKLILENLTSTNNFFNFCREKRLTTETSWTIEIDRLLNSLATTAS